MHCLPFSRIMVFTGIYTIQSMHAIFPDEQSDYTTLKYNGGQAAGSHCAKGALHSFMYVMIIW